MHIHFLLPPSMLFPNLWMERGSSSTKQYIIPVTSHPCRIQVLGDRSSCGETCFYSYGALVERADRDRRVDRDAPNERSVAQLRAELWPETCFELGRTWRHAEPRGTSRNFANLRGSSRNLAEPRGTSQNFRRPP